MASSARVPQIGISFEQVRNERIFSNNSSSPPPRDNNLMRERPNQNLRPKRKKREVGRERGGNENVASDGQSQLIRRPSEQNSGARESRLSKFRRRIDQSRQRQSQFISPVEKKNHALLDDDLISPRANRNLPLLHGQRQLSAQPSE